MPGATWTGWMLPLVFILYSPRIVQCPVDMAYLSRDLVGCIGIGGWIGVAVDTAQVCLYRLVVQYSMHLGEEVV